MNKQIYIGNTPLIDLTGYATESYVDSAVANVDVTEQLTNYVLQTSLDASISAVDASIANSDASIEAIKTTLADIVSDGSTDSVINTWAEMKAFLADYTTVSDLSTLISSVKSSVIDDVSSAYLKKNDASQYVSYNQVYLKPEINEQLEIITGAITTLDSSVSTYYAKKSDVSAFVTADDLSTFITSDDISTFVDAAAVATAINSSITALDLANTYQPIGSYLVADDISTFITNDDISTFITSDDISTFITNDDISTFVDSATVAATYETKNDASNHVAGAGVTNIVTISAADYALLEEKSATTLYIVSD